MKKIVIILIFLSGFQLENLFAQQEWSLAKCIEYALTNNLDIKSSELTTRTYQNLVEKAKLNYIPDLNLNIGHQFSFNRSLESITYTFIENTSVNTLNPNISLGMIIFDGFNKYNSYRKSLFDLDISEMDFEILKDDLSLSITMNYMNILLNKEIIKSIRQQISISDITIEKAQRLLEEGLFTDERLQNLLLQRNNELYSLTEAEGSLINAKISMCSLLNLEDYVSFDIVEEMVETIVDIPLVEIIASAQSLPQIKSMEAKLKSAAYDLKIIKSGLYPTISLGASYATSYSDSRRKGRIDHDGNLLISDDKILYKKYSLGNQLNDYRNGFISLNFNIPIHNIFHTKKNISIAKNNILQVEYQLQNSKKILNERIYQIYSEVEIAKRKYDLSLSSVENAKIILLYADNKLINGALTVSDYVITKGSLLMAEAQASKAKYEYYLKFKLLKYYYYHTL